MTVTDTLQVVSGDALTIDIVLDPRPEGELLALYRTPRTEIPAQEPCGRVAWSEVREWYAASGRRAIARMETGRALPHEVGPLDNDQLCHHLVSLVLQYTIRRDPGWGRGDDGSPTNWALVAWNFASAGPVIVAEGVQHGPSLLGGPGGPKDGASRMYVILQAATLRVLGHEQWSGQQ
jgi:hypothetical protein